MKKHDVVILHGTCGSPDGNWFPWLSDRLRADGHRVFVPHFPTPENQSVETWDMALGPQVPDFGPDTILIGHSCGATYMLHILESLSSPIRASVFVSGFAEKLGDDYFDNQNETFINHDFDWDKIRRNAGKITLFYGDNDPYVSRDAAENFAKNLGAPLTVIPNGGHLNTEFGYTEFPKLLEVLK